MNTDWFTAGNWTGTPAGYPVSGDSARLGVVTTTPMPTVWPDYNGDNSASPPTGAFTISQVMDAWFTMSSGVFTQASGNINLGNGSGFTGTWTHNGGSFTAQGSTMQIAPAANAMGNLTLNAGSITVNTLNLGTGAGAIANLTIHNALFYVNTFINLNNSSKTGTDVNLTIGNGGVLDVDRAEFYKSDTVIGPGGIFRIRNSSGVGTPVSIRTLNYVDLAGGDMFIRADYTGIVPGWINDGKLFTSIPGNYVTWNYDSDTGYTRIWSIPEPTTWGLLALGLGLVLRRRRG